MTREETARVMEGYAASHDTSHLAPDAVFEDVTSGHKYVGREAIAEMLHFVYHVAFDATAAVTQLTIGEGHAVLEADLVGTHIGEFADVPATGREVKIPLVVAYDVSDGMIESARVYLMTSSFLRQVTAREVSPAV